jgi:hypothetical protein
MTILRFIISLAIIATLVLPTFSLAKMGIRLQQEVALISTQDSDGTLHTANTEIYVINNKEIKQKANAYIGQQIRILYFNMAQKKVCVDIAPATEPPFEITAPSTSKATHPL